MEFISNKLGIIYVATNLINNKQFEELDEMECFWIQMYGVNRSGNQNPMWGKRHSPETIEKMKQSALNRKKR